MRRAAGTSDFAHARMDGEGGFKQDSDSLRAAVASEELGSQSHLKTLVAVRPRGEAKEQPRTRFRKNKQFRTNAPSGALFLFLWRQPVDWGR